MFLTMRLHLLLLSESLGGDREIGTVVFVRPTKPLFRALAASFHAFWGGREVWPNLEAISAYTLQLFPFSIIIKDVYLRALSIHRHFHIIIVYSSLA